MTVFKTYLKILSKCKVPIILYTVLLVFFGGFNIQNNSESLSFQESKPSIVIVNEDERVGLTDSLISYLEANSVVEDIEIEESAIRDAIFYRKVNYAIYIPKNFHRDFLNGEEPYIKINSAGDYQASLAEMLLNRYLNLAEVYRTVFDEEEKMIEKMEKLLEKEIEVELTSSLDTTAVEKASLYYNFTNYCFLAGLIYVICLVLSSFKNEGVFKRTAVSSTDYRQLNRKLLFSNGVFAFALWLLYVLLSFVLCGKIMWSENGLLLIVNSFVFLFCCLTFALLLGNAIRNKEAINGLVNVIALGSSFLCGTFVPMSFLPKSVLTIAHALPSYWYISTNEAIKSLEKIEWNTMLPILVNMAVLLGFSLVFILATNWISRRKRQLN